MSDETPLGSGELQHSRVSGLRDLSDFCQHWPELREIATDPTFLGDNPSDERRAMMTWLVALADRICGSGQV
ncbi:MAG: hypothetical protein AAFQ88_01905 [Pseudomonadota bacterium]